MPQDSRRIGRPRRFEIDVAAVANLVGTPFASFALGDVSKVTMIFLMWLGRLEIIPVVVLFTRNYRRLRTWARHASPTFREGRIAAA